MKNISAKSWWYRILKNNFPNDIWEYEQTRKINSCFISKMLMVVFLRKITDLFSRKFIWIPAVSFVFVYAIFCAIYFGLGYDAIKNDNNIKVALEQLYRNYPFMSYASFMFFNEPIIIIATFLGLMCVTIMLFFTACAVVIFMAVGINKIRIKTKDSAEKESILAIFWRWLKDKTCIKYKITDLDEK